jgi:hypothetical protein
MVLTRLLQRKKSAYFEEAFISRATYPGQPGNLSGERRTRRKLTTTTN